MASEEENHEDLLTCFKKIEEEIRLRVERTQKASKTLEREIVTFKKKQQAVENLLKHIKPEKIERLEAFHKSFKALYEIE